MLIITDNSLDFKPLVDLREYDFLEEELKNALLEYILSNQQRVMTDGQLVKAFYVSGFADHHHNRLCDYLNRTVFKPHDLQSEIVRGSFADYPLTHSWLEIGDLIIDIAISQFRNKNAEMLESLRPYLQSHCFISDNPQNYFYSLYRKV